MIKLFIRLIFYLVIFYKLSIERIDDIMYYEEFENDDAYEAMCDQTRKENETYLKIFEADLKAKGLVGKTIRKHVNNIHFYI